MRMKFGCVRGSGFAARCEAVRGHGFAARCEAGLCPAGKLLFQQRAMPAVRAWPLKPWAKGRTGGIAPTSKRALTAGQSPASLRAARPAVGAHIADVAALRLTSRGAAGSRQAHIADVALALRLTSRGEAGGQRSYRRRSLALR